MNADKTVTIAAALRPVPPVPMVLATVKMLLMAAAQPRSLAAPLAGPTADQNLARGALKVPALALFRPNWFCSASEDQPATTRFARKQQFLTPAPRS